MATIMNSEAQHVLSKLMTQDATTLAISHPWLWERDRWKELIFALLTRIANLSEDRLRELTDNMDDLGLLDISSLASIIKDTKSINLNNAQARHILEILQEYGFSAEEAQKGLTTICEAAVGLQKHFSGKVQLYLRGYGESMLREIDGKFQFSALKSPEVKYAFTYWLQNVLNMPISLLDTNTLSFCEKYHLTPEQLVAAADDLDLNLALLDDLIQNYVSTQAKAQG